MIYLKKFQTNEEYETYASDAEGFDSPNVSFSINNSKVHYAKKALYDEVNGFFCSGATGYDKYFNVYDRVTYDRGITWKIMSSATTLVEQDSEYCEFCTIPYTATSKLQEATNVGNSEGLHVNAFSGDSGQLTLISHTFENGVGLLKFNAPILRIGEMAFFACSSLTNVNLSSYVASLDKLSFCDCNGLTSISIPSGVTTIDDYAFANCFGLTNLIIPDNVTIIGNNAFHACTNIASCTIGSGITEIQSEAFNQCISLASVTVKASTPPTLGDDVFIYNASTRTIYVPSGSVNTYKTADGWSNYASDIESI